MDCQWLQDKLVYLCIGVPVFWEITEFGLQSFSELKVKRFSSSEFRVSKFHAKSRALRRDSWGCALPQGSTQEKQFIWEKVESFTQLSDSEPLLLIVYVQLPKDKDKVIFIMHIVVSAEDAAVGNTPYVPIIDLLHFLILNIWFSLPLSLLTGSHRDLCKQIPKILCQEHWFPMSPDCEFYPRWHSNGMGSRFNF